MIWTTTPQSFIALGFLKLGHFIRFGSYSQSQDLITFCRPGSSLKILAQFHYQKHFLKIQFKYDQILCWYVIANVLHNIAVTLLKCHLQTFNTTLWSRWWNVVCKRTSQCCRNVAGGLITNVGFEHCSDIARMLPVNITFWRCWNAFWSLQNDVAATLHCKW